MRTVLLIQLLAVSTIGNSNEPFFVKPEAPKPQQRVAVFVVPKPVKTAPVAKQQKKSNAVLVSPKYPIEWVQMREGVKEFEGFYPNKYRCSGGKVTIGYGHTDTAKSLSSVSREMADELLNQDLEKSREKVLQIVKVPLSEAQLACLTSFTFNCGESSLRKMVNGDGRLNDGNYDSIKQILPLYRRANGKILRGLVSRRKWELSLWKSEEMNFAQN